jgi:hypothetical protein
VLAARCLRKDAKRNLYPATPEADFLALPNAGWYFGDMKRIWINRAGSFREAQVFDTEYYARLSREERLEAVQILREEYFKSRGLEFCEDGKRLRRVFRVVKQA